MFYIKCKIWNRLFPLSSTGCSPTVILPMINLLDINVQLFLKHGYCNWGYFKLQKRSVYACSVRIMEYYWIIKTVQKILSKQKPPVPWYRTHCILFQVEVSVERTVSRPVITIRASYSTGRSADRQLRVSVTGWSWKGGQLLACLIVSRSEPTKVILQI